MAYAFGSSVTGSDLMNAIHAFILTLNPTNWTVVESHDNDWTTGDVGNPLVVQHSNGTVGDDVFVSLWRSSTANFGMNLATGYTDSSTLWYNQPGARRSESDDQYTSQRFCRTSNGDNDISQYHLFGYDDFLYVVFKTETQGLWRNFGFGHMTKIDTFNGGGFCCASYCSADPVYEDNAGAGGYTQFFDNFYAGTTLQVGTDREQCSQIRIDDGLTLRYVLSTVEDTIQAGPGGTNWPRIFGANDTYGFSGNPYFPSGTANEVIEPFEAPKVHNAPSSFGLTSPLVPIYHYISRGNGQRSLTSTLPNIFCLNIRDLVETQEIDIQGSPYMVFPASKKTDEPDQDGTNQPNSYRYGFCILKDV